MNSPIREWSETIETTVIDGFDVELIIEKDGGDIVSSAFVTRGEFGASFAYLEANGSLYHNDGDHIEQAVADRTVSAIHEWLLEHGY